MATKIVGESISVSLESKSSAKLEITSVFILGNLNEPPSVEFRIGLHGLPDSALETRSNRLLGNFWLAEGGEI